MFPSRTPAWHCRRVTRINAWLFDLDGTLVDSEPASVRAWARIAERHALDLAAILRVHGGRPPEGTLALAAPHLPAATAAAAVADLWRGLYDDVSDVVAHTGAHELIRGIESAGLPWAIVTACDRRLAAARLGAAGITPALVVTSEELTAGKPDPQGYRLAAARLGVAPAECLVIEDAAAGVEAGRRAGMRVAGVHGCEGDLTVARLADLMSLV
jgi:beta-phosphoglucomutase-like phosphatase (HAD superfamily)